VTTYSIGQGELTPPIGGATISWSRASALRLTDRTATPVVATRVLRAPLPPTDFCVGDPSGEARGLVDDGFTTHYEYALQALERGWLTTGGGVRPRGCRALLRAAAARSRNDQVRPNEIVAEATDWRFLSELKRHLKS
jgi:NitT/TauT family transport system substrate-binding protein